MLAEITDPSKDLITSKVAPDPEPPVDATPL